MQLSISNFACRLLDNSTVIAKVNLCIHYHFCITIIIMLYFSANTKTEILCTDVYVVKYVGRLIAVYVPNYFLDNLFSQNMFSYGQKH